MRAPARLALFLFAAALAASCGSNGSDSGQGGNPTTDTGSDCLVRFGVTSVMSLAGLQIDVDYQKARGLFVGAGDAVECERIDERFAAWGTNQCRGTGGECRDGDPHKLTITAEATHDVVAPAELIECRFLGERLSRMEEFVPVVVDAYDEHVVELPSRPTVEVTGITCQSTSSTTSTTVESSDPCVDITCPNGEVCIDGRCAPTTHYLIDLDLDQPERFGALQFDILHDCSEGTFDGEDDQVRCVGNPDLNAYSAFHDTDCEPASGEPRVSLSAITLDSFTGPVRVATCEYSDATGSAPTADRFRIVVVDATDPDLVPIPDTTVSVANIRPSPR